ncbi:hypothetical protein ACN4EG_21110 [Alkalinema pantanalense CENA528]|uniref:hypothetical protein n=1 Tax=Alkalinema pantanalense TaxID=1620705 RepID=UPI003D6EC8A0
MTSFARTLQDELLHRSRKFSKLYYYSLLANTMLVTLSCILLILGKGQETVFSAMVGFGSTAVIRLAGKEANQSLIMLIQLVGHSSSSSD